MELVEIVARAYFETALGRHALRLSQGDEMTKADELNALADRCEREEPSHNLNCSIGCAVDAEPGVMPPAYTTSLDAAVTLVPEGWNWGVWSNGCAMTWSDIPSTHVQANRRNLPPALALCAAALRARAALSQTEAEEGK
jgi:hypothetical protein